jgi:hypothetical protein
MSFSSDVKEELAEVMPKARHCRIAEISAIMHFAGQIGVMPGGEVASSQKGNIPSLSSHRPAKATCFLWHPRRLPEETGGVGRQRQRPA